MCGVLGFSGDFNIVNIEDFKKGLTSLTNRGRDSMGIVVKDSQGKVSWIINKNESEVDSLENKEGNVLMLGHCRYATFGKFDNKNNIQPHSHKDFYLAHNGNIPEIEKYKNQLKNASLIKGTSDSEILLHRIVQNSEKMGLEKAVQQVIEEIKGAFSVIMMNGKNMVAFRDKWGIRPLYFGKFEKNSFGFASEDRVLENLGSIDVKEIEPGETISINNGTLTSFMENNIEKPKFCSLEMVYLLSKDSKYRGQLLSEYRRKLGIKLSEEFPDLKADFVIGIPNSGIPAAKGFASAKNIPYLEELFIDPKYEGDRSFISPEEQRKVVARNKFLLKSNNLNGKKIIIIDDSIIRGTVLTVICELFREAGVSEIHICSSLPPVMDICDLGIFLPTKNELLLGNNSDYSTAASKVGATSINFLSLDGLKDVLGKEICTGCLGEEYPF